MASTRSRALLAVLLFLAGRSAFGNTSDLATRLFERLAGVPLALRDTRRAKIEALINAGNLLDAAAIASDDPGFYNITLRLWALPLADIDETTFTPLNDLSAMVIGLVRDKRDFREVLSGDFTYVGPSLFGGKEIPPPSQYSNAHYTQLADMNFNFRQELVRVEPQRPDFPDAAGVLTSRAWGQTFFSSGTNRRSTVQAFQRFLCTSIDQLGDALISDNRVHRDVDRAPGGDTNIYLNTCRRCHSGMDALTGAFAHYDFRQLNDGPHVVWENKVQKKYNKNGFVYPAGYITIDDSWMNLWTKNQNAELGWRGPLSGNGAKSFGAMLANSKAFSRCMVKRTFNQVCRRAPIPSESAQLETITEQFESEGYQLDKVFQKVAVLPQCLGSE